MKHLHLFEFTDQVWLPEMFRNMITQITQFNLDFFKIYDVIFPKVEQFLQTTGESQVIDLCSGSSGPWLRLLKQLKSPVKVILTDKYPNLGKWRQVMEVAQGRMECSASSVDAVAVPGELKGLRTIFTGFHHFRPEEAKIILETAVAQNEPIAIFEFTERSFPSLIRAIWLYMLVTLVQTPFIKPRTLARFFWTYLLPVIPILHWWDGLVSNVRTYSPRELQEIVNSIDSKEYQWEIGLETFRTYGMKARITYLLGYNPKQNHK